MEAIIGALIGDAVGATLEGLRKKDITELMVQHALTMPGGGLLQVGPGQITDDGELTLAAFQALRDSNPILGLPTYRLIQQYIACPFDVIVIE